MSIVYKTKCRERGCKTILLQLEPIKTCVDLQANIIKKGGLNKLYMDIYMNNKTKIKANERKKRRQQTFTQRRLSSIAYRAHRPPPVAYRPPPVAPVTYRPPPVAYRPLPVDRPPPVAYRADRPLPVVYRPHPVAPVLYFNQNILQYIRDFKNRFDPHGPPFSDKDLIEYMRNYEYNNCLIRGDFHCSPLSDKELKLYIETMIENVRKVRFR